MEEYGILCAKGYLLFFTDFKDIPLILFQNEKLVAPADGHNTTGQYDPKQHGYHGAILTSLTGNDGIPLDAHVLATTQELASEFPFRLDMTGGSQGVLGIGSLLPLDPTIRELSNLQAPSFHLLATGKGAAQPPVTSIQLWVVPTLMSSLTHK